METFALAAISLTIAISLFIKKMKGPVHQTFALLCFALFLQKTGAFSFEIFNVDAWKIVNYTGALAIPPLLISFCRAFLNRQEFPSKKIMLATVLGSLFLIAFLFTFGYKWPYMYIVLYLYNGSAMIYCYIALIDSIKKETPGVQRKGMFYIAIACALTVILSISDVFHYYGSALPPLSNIAIAALIYFTLIIITHHRLPEIHEIMVRALIIFALVLFATITFYFVIALFGKNSSRWLNSVLMASFIIVIFIDPVKMIFKKVAGHLFFEGRSDVSISLYAIDEEVEREKSMLLEEMATGLAHEIRNPLGAIKGAAQYLKSETELPQNRKLLDVIVEETDRLNGVMSQFLNYARPHSINTSNQDVNRIIAKVVSLLKTAGLPENVVIEENLDSELPAIKVDGEQMTQVILNMALNGIEAMPEGGTLSLTTAQIENNGNKTVEITIRDTGSGIEEKDSKNIFKPFFTTKKKGTGLGLPVCRRIIKSHGGSIDLESVPGEGTAFFIRI
ncbi:MAG: ATP-binding protein [Thermodesulfobacteriota bacterium]|nr:ATP-binding protein [Thermodesulfobacteriota bacterium]